MPKPSEQPGHQVEKPESNNDYFERMSRIIFMSGLNWKTLEKKWPGIKQAFAGFEIDEVADFGEPEVDRLMSNPDVIRNLPKINAVIANAQQMQAIKKDFGSFAAYLDQLRPAGEDAMRADIIKRFAFMGKGTSVIFLFSIGEDLPRASKEWHGRHS